MYCPIPCEAPVTMAVRGSMVHTPFIDSYTVESKIILL